MTRSCSWGVILGGSGSADPEGAQFCVTRIAGPRLLGNDVQGGGCGARKPVFQADQASSVLYHPKPVLPPLSAEALEMAGVEGGNDKFRHNIQLKRYLTA